MQTRTRSTRRRIIALAVLAVALGLVALAAARLAPTEIGGGTTYVVVTDGSMEPALHPGDLALLQRRDAYEVADVVAVHGAGGLLPRRVIGVSDGLLSLKADASEAADRAGTPPDAVVGALVVSVPGAGHALGWLRQPRHLALIGLALGLCSLAILAVAWPRRRRPPAVPGPASVAPPVVAVVGLPHVDAPIVEVASFESLVELARYAGAVILEERAEGTLRYFVDDGVSAYRFTACGSGRAPAPGEPLRQGLGLPEPLGLLPGRSA